MKKKDITTFLVILAAIILPVACGQNASTDQAAQGGEPGETAQIDPICNMKVFPSNAKASLEKDGKNYYFCSPHCKEEFEKQ